jgi:hypothetical protein
MGISLYAIATNRVRNIQTQRLAQCIKIFQKHLYFPDDFRIVKTLLGAVAGNYVTSNPVWLMTVGPSGGGKSELLNTLRGNKDMRFVGDLSEAGMLHWSKDRKGEPIARGVLPDVGEFGILGISEFSTILQANRNKQKPLLALLRMAHDGYVERGIRSDAGELLAWKGRLGCIAMSAPGVDSQRNVIAEMGERFVYARLAYSDDDRQKIRDLRGQRDADKDRWRLELQDAVNQVLTPLMNVKHPPFHLQRAEISLLSEMAEFCSRARSVVERNESFSKDVEEIHTNELGSGRLMDEFSSLLCGLLAIGVDYDETWRIMFNIMWSSIPLMRARILRTLFSITDFSDPKYYGGVRAIVKLLDDDPQYNYKVVERAVNRGLEDLVFHRVLDIRRYGKRGASNEYKIVFPVLESYARIISTKLEDPA